MQSFRSLSLAFALFCALVLSAQAQLSPDKVAALKARFATGKDMAEKGEFKNALKVFRGILDEDPNARGSLFMSGVMCNQLYDYAAAADYLERFLTLEPQHTAGLINAIKANQGLDNTAKVEQYRTRLFERRRLAVDPVLNLMENYERQRIPLKDGGYLSIQEAFNPHGEEAVYIVLRLNQAQKVVSKEEVAKAPANAGPEMKGSYLWAEPHYKGDVIERYEIKKVLPTLPAYKDLQGWVTEEYAAQIAK